MGEEKRTETVAFVNGEALLTLTEGETVVISLPYGTDWTVAELLFPGDEEEEAGSSVLPDTVTVFAGEEMIAHTEYWSDGDKAPAADGTITEDTLVKFVNSYLEYFDIDKEIVDDQEDIFNRDSWVKDEGVNEYNAIEIDMTNHISSGSNDGGSGQREFHHAVPQ